MSHQHVCGRLSLSSNLSHTRSNYVDVNSIFFVAHKGNSFELYDGTQWKSYVFGGTGYIEKILTSLPANRNVDVFLYDNNGSVELDLVLWLNNTTREINLDYQDRILVLQGQKHKRYLGTIRTTSPNLTEDSANKRFVWNYYNQIEYANFSHDTTDSFVVTGNGLWSPVNNGNPVWKHEFVIGVQSQIFKAKAVLSGQSGFVIGLSINSTFNINKLKTSLGCNVSNSAQTCTADFLDYPNIGHNVVQALQTTVNTSVTCYGDNTGLIGNGIYGINSGLFVNGYK